MRSFYLSVLDRDNAGTLGLWNPVEEKELDFSTIYQAKNLKPFQIKSRADARLLMDLLPDGCFFSFPDLRKPGFRVFFQKDNGQIYLADTDRPEPEWNAITPVHPGVMWSFRKELNTRIKQDTGITKF